MEPRPRTTVLLWLLIDHAVRTARPLVWSRYRIATDLGWLLAFTAVAVAAVAVTVAVSTFTAVTVAVVAIAVAVTVSAFIAVAVDVIVAAVAVATNGNHPIATASRRCSKIHYVMQFRNHMF